MLWPQTPLFVKTIEFLIGIRVEHSKENNKVN